jgi:hypothetical protein
MPYLLVLRHGIRLSITRWNAVQVFHAHSPTNIFKFQQPASEVWVVETSAWPQFHDKNISVNTNNVVLIDGFDSKHIWRYLIAMIPMLTWKGAGASISWGPASSLSVSVSHSGGVTVPWSAGLLPVADGKLRTSFRNCRTKPVNRVDVCFRRTNLQGVLDTSVYTCCGVLDNLPRISIWTLLANRAHLTVEFRCLETMWV